MKGKENVLSEVDLMMTVYNLRRLMSIFSADELKSKLKELAFDFLKIFRLNQAVLATFFVQKEMKVREGRQKIMPLQTVLMKNKRYF
ncbi:MAG: hypothetical protein COA33_012420 [Fluviicola sp.]|nr:hypothetical protein [Fluviicola sp.]